MIDISPTFSTCKENHPERLCDFCNHCVVLHDEFKYKCVCNVCDKFLKKRDWE